VQDKSPKGTVAGILGGINGRAETDGSSRPCSNAVNTGWASSTKLTASDVLTLSGMAGYLGSDRTDVYALSMSYTPGHVVGSELKSGTFGLATADAHGNWIRAAKGKFVSCPWNPKHALGT